MLAKVQAATLVGVSGAAVSVEVHVSSGIPGFTIVGLPDTSCREARDRVRAAILSSGFKWPSQRMTVNLAPSNITKAGTGLDLAIAVGLLVADEQVELDIDEVGFVGELGLDGSVRAIPGVLPMVASLDVERLVVPKQNSFEAAVLQSFEVVALESLAQLHDVPEQGWPPHVPERGPKSPSAEASNLDLCDVRGHRFGRFALEVAAAGGHHMLMVGPPGAGKTMLAERLPALLGGLDRSTALETTMIHSAAGSSLPDAGLIETAPFRAPHHTASRVALIGGGSRHLRPGEVSLAHGGVLFLDELGEFPASVLDALRQPLEEGIIRISRANANVEMPARFQLVAAMNPCPCGMAGSGSCRCSESALLRYSRRVSGPLLDRFDIRISLSPARTDALLGPAVGESSAEVSERVGRARDVAFERGVTANSLLGPAALDEYAVLSREASEMLAVFLDSGSLSGRGLRRLRALGLTIADLSGLDGELSVETVSTALALRSATSQLIDDRVSS